MRRDEETPDADVRRSITTSWGVSSADDVPLDAMRIDEQPVTLPSPIPAVSLNWTDVLAANSSHADGAVAERFDVAGPEGIPSDPVIASALLNEPQQEGLRYLINYANKSIRRNRTVAEHDRDDLLHDIYMEWWICTGFEVAALPKLLETDSPERQSLRESIYRVFGRYRYHQTAHRTFDLVDGDGTTVKPMDETVDFTMDLDRWMQSLPDLEAKIIDLYYFQHKTMDEIGAEIGLAKQRVSEIHKRALSRHPDASDE